MAKQEELNNQESGSEETRTPEQEDFQRQLEEIAASTSAEKKHEETQESPEVNFGDIAEDIKTRLENIWVGGDKDGEDVFTDADNSEEVMKEVNEIIQQATAEKWTEDKLKEKLGGITVKMDVDHAQRLMQGASLDRKIKSEMLLRDIFIAGF